MVELFIQILGDITGNLDAKKACNEALKLHKKYLNKVIIISFMFFMDLKLLSGHENDNLIRNLDIQISYLLFSHIGKEIINVGGEHPSTCY